MKIEIVSHDPPEQSFLIFAQTGPLLFDTDPYVSAVSQYRYAKRAQR